jgi:UDP-N-acetylmuramate--alanine ligase
VRNAAAAAAVGLSLNVPADLIRAGLAKFSGVGRRFEIKGEFGGVTLIDDYGHHPAEIRATLEAARGCGYKRLLVLFQPHRYSRTQVLWEDFRSSFNQADILVMTEIYAAGEAPIEGVNGEILSEAISTAGHKNVVFTSTMQAGMEFLYREARPGDAILTIGAGSVGRVLDQLAMLLASKVPSSYAD